MGGDDFRVQLHVIPWPVPRVARAGKELVDLERAVRVEVQGIEVELELTWEFPDKNPREAILQELFDGLARGGPFPGDLPAPIGKFQGKYQTLPVVRDAVFPPVPPRPWSGGPVRPPAPSDRGRPHELRDDSAPR